MKKLALVAILVMIGFLLPSTVMAQPPPVVPPVPPLFTLSNLRIQPVEVQLGETVNITVTVTNIGGSEGVYPVVLMIEGIKEAQKSVTVAIGKSEDVTFLVNKEVGWHEVAIGELKGHFTVLVPPPPPKPAPVFFLSNLRIEPAEVQFGKAVTVTVTVTNVGGSEGVYPVVLMIEGVKEAEKNVTLDAGKSENVTFSVIKGMAGTYRVTIEELSDILTVMAPPPPPVKVINWYFIGGVIALAMMVGLFISLFILKKQIEPPKQTD